MATLNIASKANQASSLPALLVTSYAKESDSNASIEINLEDVDVLRSSDKASAELIRGNLPSVYNGEDIINELLSFYPFLQGKHAELVRALDYEHRE